MDNIIEGKKELYERGCLGDFIAKGLNNVY